MRKLILALKHFGELAAAKLPANSIMIFEYLIASYLSQFYHPLEDHIFVSMIEILNPSTLFHDLHLTIVVFKTVLPQAYVVQVLPAI